MSASWDENATSFQKLNTQRAFWALIAFIAAQRFLLPGVSEFICLIPFAAALRHFGCNEKLCNSLLILALFWSVDHAVVENGETPAVVRYLIYATTTLTLALNSSITKMGFLGTAIAFVLYLGTTLAHVNENLSGMQMWRDIQILVLGGILFSLRKRQPYELDFGLLFYATIGYLFSECVNYLAFAEVWYGHYMSYASTKYLIAIPSLMALFVGRPLVAWTLVGLTILALVGYTSRSLFLGYLISLIAILTLLPIQNGRIKRFLVVGCIVPAVLVSANLDLETILQSRKALNMFYLLQVHGANSLEILDPVRFASSAIFFELTLFDLLFGRGLGSGLYDSNGLLGFVEINQSAFSAQELNSNYFFNFHDVWVDLGLRFGLLPLTLFVVWLVRLRPTSNCPQTAIWILAFIGVFSAFFGVSGLISIAILLRVLQSYRAAHV